MKRNIQNVIFTMIFSIPANFLAAGDHAGNGGGSAEQNIVYAYQYLDQFIANCLNNSVCGISANDKIILERIKASLIQEGPAQDLFLFRTSTEENFVLDGAMRVAKTGSSVGSKVYINRDMIYEVNNGKSSAMGIPQAVGLLIHELGHHHEISDHTYLDLLGVKLRIFLQRSAIFLNFDPRLFMTENAFENLPFIPSLSVIYLKPNNKFQPDTRLIINDWSDAIELTQLVLPSLKDFSKQSEANGGHALCEYKGEQGIKKGEIVGFDLLSPRWEQSYYYKPFAQAPRFLLRLNFVLNVLCKADGVDPWIPSGLTYEIKLTFNKDDNKLIYNKVTGLNPTILYRDPFGR